MRVRRIIVVLAILSAGSVASAQDHLEPEKGVLNQEKWVTRYEATLRSVLFKEAPDRYLLRMVCDASFELPWAVTVYKDEKLNHFVEYVVADDRIGYLKPNPNVKAKRTRAPIDPETAVVLHDIWRRMLIETKYPDQPRHGDDGETFHFSRELPGFGDLDGSEEGQIWSPEDDSLTGKLAGLGQELKRYTLAKPENRDEVRREIRAIADRLQTKLNQRAKKQ